MTQTSAETRTGVLRLRVRFDTTQGLSILDAQDALFGLAGLVYVGHVMAEADSSSVVPRAGTSAEVLDRHAKSATESTRVERIGYNSPLEVVLAITTAGASVTALGAAVLALVGRFDNLRTQMSRGRAHRAALAVVIQDLEGRKVSTGDLRKQRHVDLLLEGAATAALQVSEVDVETDI